jgi:hypothetical protein
MASRLSREFFLYLFYHDFACEASKIRQQYVKVYIKVTHGLTAISGIFLYLFYHDFAKNIWSAKVFLQKYTSGALAYGVRDITLWAATLGAARSGP